MKDIQPVLFDLIQNGYTVKQFSSIVYTATIQKHSRKFTYQVTTINQNVVVRQIHKGTPVTDYRQFETTFHLPIEFVD